MGKKVVFATTNWKNRPNKPSDKTQAEWDAESSSGFSGFPFPIYVGKKWTNEMDYFKKTRTVTYDEGGAVISDSNYFTSVDIGDQSLNSASHQLSCYYGGDCDFAGTSTAYSYYYQKKISGWMEPKTLDPIEGPKDEYEYPDYNIENLIPQGVSTKKRFIIGDFSGFFGPFTRDDITRFYWTRRAYSLSNQVQGISTNPDYYVSYLQYPNIGGTNSPPFTADFPPNDFREDEVKAKVQGYELIVCDIDSPSDFYISLGDYMLQLSIVGDDVSIGYLNPFSNIGNAATQFSSYVTSTCEEADYPGRVNEESTLTLIGNPMSYSVNGSYYSIYGGEYGSIVSYSASSTVENVIIPLYLWPGKVVNIESTKRTSAAQAYSSVPLCEGEASQAGPLSSIIITQEPEFKVVRFLEYDDGNGNPIYDKYTGAILRDPVTGEAQE